MSTQALIEYAEASWKKRFFTTHYSYRDSVDIPATPAPATPGVYVFGKNARAISMYNWPQVGDWPDSVNTYAREIRLYPVTDSWVQLISLNPRYLILVTQGKPPGTVPATITERPQFLPAGVPHRLSPTYGVSMLYYFDLAPGRLVVDIEGNAEGTE